MKEYMLIICNLRNHDSAWSAEHRESFLKKCESYNDVEEAIAIARKNPEFEFGSTARIEVRQIKTRENSTGFVYPENV